MPEVNDAQPVFARLERLESQTRRLKRGGLVGLLIVAGVLAMAEVRPPEPIKASEFDLVDAAGITRATLDFSGGNPQLSLLRKGGVQIRIGRNDGIEVDGNGGRVTIAANELAYHGGGNMARVQFSPHPLIGLQDGSESISLGSTGLDFFTNGRASALIQGGANPEVVLSNASGLSEVGQPLNSTGLFLTGGDSPNITLQDRAGFRAILGTQDLSRNVSGSNETTSAAFLGLFDEKGTLIWSTPH